MSSDAPVNMVPDSEYVARFVVVSDWVRADGTIRPNAFIPPASLNLSVTRHGKLTVIQIWDRGRAVASLRKTNLYGRADVSAGRVRSIELASMRVLAHPLPENHEHAHIVGWPPGKAAQKSIAQTIAAAARYAPYADFDFRD